MHAASVKQVMIPPRIGNYTGGCEIQFRRLGEATAFPRRAGTQYCIQHYSSWTRAADTPAHLAQVAKVYAAIRSYLPGASYVNYCDLDLADYAAAYWGDNLARLIEVKQRYDPDNLFHHAQSVPVGVPVA
jgi:FAD/FMN-containing dehydrogenase